MSHFKKIYFFLLKAGGGASHLVLLFIRLYWGTLLIVIASGKWLNMEGIAAYFTDLHLPFPRFSALLVSTIELLGGISLLLGIFSRIMMVPLILVFFGAYGAAHREAITHFWSNPSLFVMQDPFLYLYASLLVFCFGPGLFSLDYWYVERKETLKRSS